MATMKENFEYFIANKHELVEKYSGKFAVIADLKVQETFDQELAAVKYAQQKFAAGTFIVQKVAPGEESYTQTYHSRVAFA